MLGRLDFKAARSAFLRGENVTQNLRRQIGIAHNTPEIIEAAYDLQAGSYIKFMTENPGHLDRFTTEIAAVLNRYVPEGGTLLDAGTGELTTLSTLANKLEKPLEKILAFDLSWSRLHRGSGYARRTMKPDALPKLKCFVAEFSEIPLASGSIDIVITVDALEPNGGRELALVNELLRVSKRYLILFEPSYELNSREGKQRMDRLGYIKDLPAVIAKLGATLIETIPIRTLANPLTPTVAHVIEGGAKRQATALFTDPGSDTHLVRLADCFFSPDRGVSYPVIGGIPILRNSAAILTSALADG